MSIRRFFKKIFYSQEKINDYKTHTNITLFRHINGQVLLALLASLSRTCKVNWNLKVKCKVLKDTLFQATQVD